MTYFAFSGLVNGLVCTVCGLVVLFQNPSSRKNRLHALLCAALSVWSYFYCAWQLAPNADTALLRARGIMFGITWLPTFAYHDMLAILGMETASRSRLLKFFYPCTIFFAAMAFTPYMVAGVEPRSIFPFWPVPGPLHHVFIVFFASVVWLSFRNIWLFRQSASAYVRNQISWIVVATAFGWTGGIANYLLWYNIPVIPYSNILISVYIATTTFLFFNLGLLDVRAALKHISAVLIIYGSLLALTLPGLLPLARHLLVNTGANATMVLVLFGLAIGATLSVGPFIYAYLIGQGFWLKGQMTMGLTHELKSPLATIQSSLEILRIKIETGQSKAEVFEYLDLIERNSLRLDKSVQDLLHVAKIQETEICLSREPVRLDELIHEVIEDFRPLADRKNLKFTFGTISSSETQADREKIAMVISNLVSNAIKYSENGEIRIQVIDGPGKIECSILDQGQGIDAQEIPKVFGRFYQGAHAAKGSGLGLAIAKAWVEAHGGEIGVESDGVGKGSRFWFTIPK